MSIVKMTVEQCWDLGLWDKYCEYSGCNPYAINEGQIDKDTIIEFDSEFKKEEIREDKKLLYMIAIYNENMEEQDTEYLDTTINNYKEDMQNKINSIIYNNHIIGMIRLETDLDNE